jgi:alkylation response protein AidB-like acyl-CoA dehydrogenase
MAAQVAGDREAENGRIKAMEGSVGSKGTSFEDLKRATREIQPLVEADADEGERLYHLTDRLVAEFRRKGLYSLLIPKPLGGSELPFVEAMELVEQVSWVDGSAGWCMMVEGVMGASLGSFLRDQGARTVFPNGADVTMAGNGVPRGFARPVDGGYQIRGHWAYGSGIHHAEWIHSGCFVMDGENMKMNSDGAPEIVLCHHPKSSIELKGNWDVLGLRGTGSYDYTLKQPELLVPAHMCYMFDATEPERGGIQYTAGLIGFTSWGHTSWALGVGRRALDELAKLARGRADVFGKLCDSASFRQTFADAEAKYRAARAFVYSAWDALSERFAKGERPTLEEIALIRLAMRHLHNVISDLSTFAHRAARGASLRPSQLQRCYRDIHAGTQHILLADEILQECGKVLLGATGDNARWTMFGVKG